MNHKNDTRPSSDSYLDVFLPFMRDVDRSQRALHELALAWRMIEGSTRMNCIEDGMLILPTIEDARQHFDELEQQLIVSLVAEKTTGVLREASTKALYIIDIVVRNLYERTADVSFLATDQELCRFLSQAHDDHAGALRGACEKRLEAYRRKYTVYDAMLFMAPDGTVLAGAGDEPLPERCSDPVIQQALSRDGFVQIFRYSDLQPSKPEALIYCHRMLDPLDGEPQGVLCLCFNLEDEMDGIFASHREPGARYNMLLLDGEGRCIASADPDWIPPGRTVPMNKECSAELYVYAGRLYFVATHAAAGYQGYAGPEGWVGQVMVPLDIAFSARLQTPAAASPHITTGILQHAREFCRPLHDVMIAAQTIRRVCWNGRVVSSSKAGHSPRLRTVIAQISDTGARSDAVFQRSINELRDTVLAVGLQDAGFVARLMVDLLDRNLYERANDCRWWALSPDLHSALAKPDPIASANASRVLQHINRLYTVYTSIFLYDREGNVIACSARDGRLPNIEAWRVAPAVLQRVLRQRTDQEYVVEGFGPTPFYDNGPTYVYHATVREAEGQPALGGIGLVFDATPELAAMLKDALAEKPRRQACFVDRKGRVLASSHGHYAAGDNLPLAADLLALGNGEVATHLVEWDGQYTLLGCCVSQGYREFKRTDGYSDDVLAVVLETLGEVQSGQENGWESASVQESAARFSYSAEASEEYATFRCGGSSYAIAASSVDEARPVEDLIPLSQGGQGGSVGMLQLSSDTGNGMVWVFDLAVALGTQAKSAERKEIIVVSLGQSRIGLLVDALQTVGRYDVQTLGGGPLNSPRLIQHIVTRGSAMIPALEVEALFIRLGGVRLAA